MSDIDFKIYDPCPDDSLGSGEGYHLTRIVAVVDGEEMGYIKAAYIPGDKWDELCPTPIHYQSFRGWYNVRKLFEEEGNDPDPIKLANLISRQIYWRGEKITDREKALEVIEEVQDRNRNYYEHFAKLIVDNPYVDYIRVYENHRCQGYGRALYERMARFLATKGYSLRGSGCQTDEAGRVWEKMVANPEYPTKKVVIEGLGGHPDKIRYKLDYREETATKAA